MSSASAARVIPKVTRVGAPIAEFAVSVALRHGDGAVAVHRTSPAKIDRTFVAGHEGTAIAVGRVLWWIGSR